MNDISNFSIIDNSSKIIQQTKLQDLPPALAPLIVLEHWVVWRWALNSQRKMTKIPYPARNPCGKPARVNIPNDWVDYVSACEAVEAGKADGVGFILTDTPFAAFDLDDCFIEGQLARRSPRGPGNSLRMPVCIQRTRYLGPAFG